LAIVEFMKNIDLLKLNSELELFVKERDWDQFHSVKNLTMALSVECSELVEIFQWMTEEESNGVTQDQIIIDKVQDEVADIFLYLMRILSKTNIDLESAVKSKMKKNAEKYPVALARGNSKKYSEF
jgi:dCTP diphosphatase